MIRWGLVISLQYQQQVRIQIVLMESESQDFQITAKNTSFFSGFAQTPHLTKKQNKLHKQAYENSAMETKQTSLLHKINKMTENQEQYERLNQIRERSRNKKSANIAKISVIVDDNKKDGKKKKNKTVEMEDEKDQKVEKTFQDLKLIRPLLKIISQVQYVRPTPVQKLTIPVILSGRDVVASSVTGSGKTAAFLLPILQRYYNAAPVGYIRAMIVTPTRELALQIYEQFTKLNKYIRIDGILVIGASSIQKQEASLRNNPQLVIGTPGRIIDVLMNSRSVGMQNLEMIVFDEADKLLELGFEAQIKQIMKMVNPQVQTILFSATIGSQVNKLSAETTRKPIRISANPDNKTAEKLHQQVIKLKDQSEEYREAVLLSVLLNLYQEKVIVFFKTKKQCHRMSIILSLLGITSVCQLHGNLSQTQRLEAFLNFKEGKYNYMLATDLAARGLDIKQVKTVINFELPSQLTRYIHRIGRTARAGSVGTSLTLCNDEECLELKKMSKKTGDKLFKVNLDEKVVKQSETDIRTLSEEIEHILEEERQQREIRKADMQLKRLQNMNDHQSEIYSRPKKQWFMSETEKRKIQQKAKLQAGVAPLVQKPKQNNFRGRGGPNRNGNPQKRFNNQNGGNKGGSNKFKHKLIKKNPRK